MTNPNGVTKTKENMKKLRFLLATLLAIVGTVSVQAEKKGYAALSDDGATLTFYYDEDMEVRHNNGQTTFTLPWWNGEYPGWIDSMYGNTTTTKVVFDASFKDYEGLTSTYRMFCMMYELTNIEHLDYLNTEQVTDMRDMFRHCRALQSLDVSEFDTRQVTDMSFMFYDCPTLMTISCNDNWQRSGLTSTDMFFGCSMLVSMTSNIQYMDYYDTDASMANPSTGYFTAKEQPYAVIEGETMTFYYDDEMPTRGTGATYHLPKYGRGPAWNGSTESSKVTEVVFDDSFAYYDGLTSTSNMFNRFEALTTIDGLEKLHTENVTSMRDMFSNCKSLTTLNLSTFDTRKVTDMNSMFAYCTALTTIYCEDDWKWDGLKDSKNMFANCENLRGAREFSLGDADAEWANPSTGYFTSKAYAVVSADGSTLTFYCDYDRASRTGSVYNIPKNALPGWYSDYQWDITTAVFDGSFYGESVLTSTSCLFYGLSNLTSIRNLGYVDWSKVTDMADMFSGCSSLTSLETVSLKTENVTSMARMFDGCSSLTVLDLSTFNTQKVTDMSNMFRNCSALTMIINNDDWSQYQVIASTGMFEGCTSLEGAVTFDAAKTDVSMANPTTGYFLSWDESHKQLTLHVGEQATIYLIDNAGEEYTFEGPRENGFWWLKGTPMCVEVSYHGSGLCVAHLLVDGRDVRLQYDEEKGRFTGFEISSMDDNHTIDVKMVQENRNLTLAYGEGNTASITELDADGTVLKDVGDDSGIFGLPIHAQCKARLVVTPAAGRTLKSVEMNNQPLSDDHISKDDQGRDVVTLDYAELDAKTTTYVTMIYDNGGSKGNDVNGDGKVNIADVTKLVNMILGKE